MLHNRLLYKLLFIAISFAIGMLMAACSSTGNLPAGEQLYIGIGKTKILHMDNTSEGQKALSEAEGAIKVAPNNSLFGSARWRLPLPVGLWVYNRFREDSTLVGKKIYSMFASEPIFISTVEPGVRAELARNRLREHGYFNAWVTDSIATLRKDSLQARVYYTINMGAPYQYNSIDYLPAWQLADSTLFDHAAISPIKVQEQFNVQTLTEDREAVSKFLRNQGYYYYSPDLLVYEVDTLQTPGAVAMRAQLKEGITHQMLKPWTIDRITMTVNGSYTDPATDSIYVDSVKIRYVGPRAVRRKVLRRRIFLSPGDLYRERDAIATRQQLARLGAFAFSEMQFIPIDTTRHLLELRINSLLDRPWDTSIEAAFKFKSNNFLGPGLRVSAGRRNLFGGGETLTASLFGSYEWLTGDKRTGRQILHSYELGSELSLAAPALLFPGQQDRIFKNHEVTSDFALSASLLNRARYFRMLSFAGKITYGFNNGGRHKHAFTPFWLQYNLLSHRTQEFNRIITNNPALELSLRSQLVPQISYTYTFDNIFQGHGDHHLWMEYSFSEASNLVNAIYAAAGEPYFNTKKLLGVPFAQFVKGTAEIRYSYTINRIQSFAFRMGMGAIYSFGNMQIAPYSEQFYVGGANSIRAFTVRSLGPGRYQPSASQFAFIDQTGEFKLELNAEWRVRLIGDLGGALFLDAGNVWLLRPESHRPGGALTEITGVKDFLNQVALGTGLGLRYDLGYFVIRFDLGVGLHLPYETGKRGYYNIPKFTDALGYHLAIGYPF